MRRTFYLGLLLVLWLASKIKAQSPCSSATTCNECYAIPNCAWCADRNFFPTKMRPRCEVRGILISYCNVVEDIQSSTTLEENGLNSDNQISISSAKVYLRAGETQSLRVSVRPVLNFPIDFYFLLDSSSSLEDDLENIRRISQDIINTIRGKSTRFQIGFGTYVDKPTLPYFSNSQLKNTCSDCLRIQTPTSYVHNIGLTNDSALFTNGFQSISTFKNADDPEGTFDAIFQAALCNQVVGWRLNARKIMLIITDDLSHTAGDGKLAGIVRPPPFECLTTLEESTGRITYTSNLKYDYPSISQIRRALIKAAIVPVFAVTQPNIRLYNNIVSRLDGTNAVTAELDADSNNLLTVIETAFEKTISKVALSFESQPDLTITYRATCPRNSNASPDGLSCSNVVTGDTTVFDINIKLDRCLQQENTTKTFSMVVPAYGRFEIEVNVVCSCDCHRRDVFNSSDCNNGLLSCGECFCNPEGDYTSEEECPVYRNLACGGRGSCDCGSTCRCHEPVSLPLAHNIYNVTHGSLSGYAIVTGQPPFVNGSVCECDNFFCDRNKSHFVCSGSTHGDCVCSSDGPVCECKRSEFGGFPYTGTACQCSAVYCYDTSVPYNRHSSKACTGHGTCLRCNPNEPCACNLGFTGRYCETQVNPARASCTGDKDCIRCIADNENFRDVCPCQSDARFSYMRLTSSDNEDHIIYGINADSSTTQRCTFTTPNLHCKYTYHIAFPYHSDGATFIDVEPDAGCIEAPLKWWHIILLLLSILVVLGMIKLVIVKICCRKERKEEDTMRQKLL